MSIHELQAALRALDEANSAWEAVASLPNPDGIPTPEHFSLIVAQRAVIEAARRVAEGAGEPVAWQRRLSRGDYVSAWQECGAENRHDDRADGWVREYRPLYHAPPSADALVEALGELSAQWRQGIKQRDGYHIGFIHASDRCADDIDDLIDKHKENTR